LGSLGVSLLTDELPLGIGIMIALISIAGGALTANKVGLEAGRGAMKERIRTSATPWGIEAFGRSYSELAGLEREDPEELRRRLEVPFNGRAQLAWKGELANGVDGHLSVWIDETKAPEPPRHYLLAVTASTGAEVPSGYESSERDGRRYTWQVVTAVQRSSHRLDKLREAVKG
jgi:hypothetical protein